MKIEIRIDETLLSCVDQAARNAGLSRSAWVRRQLSEGVDNHSACKVPVMSEASLEHAIHDRGRVEVRLAKLLLKRLDEEADAAGLSRTDYVRSVLHGYLYEGPHFRVLSAKSDQRFAKLEQRLGALQRMVNDIQKAVRAISRDEAFVDLSERADDLLELDQALLQAFKETRHFIQSVVVEEHVYWRSG